MNSLKWISRENFTYSFLLKFIIRIICYTVEISFVITVLLYFRFCTLFSVNSKAIFLHLNSKTFQFILNLKCSVFGYSMWEKIYRSIKNGIKISDCLYSLVLVLIFWYQICQYTFMSFMFLICFIYSLNLFKECMS